MTTSEKVLASIGKGVLIMFLMAGIGLVLAFPLKWTWNATMPYVFELPAITWGKAWCLHFLAGGIIKSIHTHNT